MRFDAGGVSIYPGPSWPLPEDSISNAFVPTTAVISLRQIGTKQAKCLVSPGDRVEECQLIGRAETPDATNVHSSIPGTVVAVRKLIAPDGVEADAAFIEFGGSFTRLGRRREIFPWKNMSIHDLLHLIGERGVPGRSPDEGPLIKSISHLRQGKAAAIFVDCSDPEPYQCAQRSCLLSKPKEIAEALDILLKVIGPAPISLCARQADDEPARALMAALAERSIQAERLRLPERYPAPSQEALRSRLKPERSDEAGDKERSPVFSPASLLSLYDAIVLNKASIEQVVTVGGDGIKHPATLRARIGMRIGDLIGECGGFKGKVSRLIVGGALTGQAVTDPDTPVLKSTQSVLALSAAEARKTATSACIRCGRCVSVCPVSLDPGVIHKLVLAGRRQDARAEGIGYCVRCAACAYVCPSRLPLLGSISGALREGWGSR